MEKLLFDTDSYEQDLAMMMLEVLEKNKQISRNTYKAVRKKLIGKDDENDDASVCGTVQDFDPFQKLQRQLYR